MKYAIVYASFSGNTEKLAFEIKRITDAEYCGKVSNFSGDAELLFVGFWTKSFQCDQEIADFLQKLRGQRVFLFGTAGYDDTEVYFKKIISNVREHLHESNILSGHYMCMGKVSSEKKTAILTENEAKYNAMKAKLASSSSHPDRKDLDALSECIKTLLK